MTKLLAKSTPTAQRKALLLRLYANVVQDNFGGHLLTQMTVANNRVAKAYLAVRSNNLGKIITTTSLEKLKNVNSEDSTYQVKEQQKHDKFALLQRKYCSVDF